MALKNADLILTNTKYNLCKLNEAGYRNTHEIFPGLIPIDGVPPFNLRKNIALSVTMWDFGRRPEVLVEIAKQLSTGKIVLCGDWTDHDYMQKTKEKIVEMKLSNKIEITGPLTESELVSYYKEAKAAVRFGYNEKGPGMGSLEAISWGIPLIINNEIGAREIVDEEECGFIVDEEDSSGVASILEELFTNEAMWNDLSRISLKTASKYTWELHNEKLSDLVENLGKVK